ncbi:SirB2 family protein [Neptunicella sp. SCSIO 80796]|uniref:SirB2 family protein n=1 Tax=Neptunicella plasticusilytica TaxID=3117012 RepID=UPI003A4D59AB
MYLFFKHLHMTLAVVSIFLFILRFIWLNRRSAMLAKKIVRITPHIIDTFLLLTAFTLCVLISQYPLVDNWLTEKVLLLIGYILFGVLALKPSHSGPVRWGSFIMAMLCIALILKLAVTKQPYLLS